VSIPPDESGAFFGRRKGKALRPGQQDLFGALLPRLRLPAEGPIDPRLEKLFGAFLPAPSGS